MKLTSTRLKKLIVEVLDEGILDQIAAEKENTAPANNAAFEGYGIC